MKILTDLDFIQSKTIILLVDNKSAIALTKNSVFHGKTKHVHVKYHAIRDTEKNGEVSVQHCTSDQQLDDIMTKMLPKLRFEYLRSKLNVQDANIKEEC